jgi:stage II sporulation protein E
MIAGFLSKFGKIGVILGFVAGNVLLAYVANGNTEEIIYLKEIVVASLGLLLVPKNMQINISDFFGQDLYLPAGRTYALESNNNTINKLNTMTETINEMSRSYKEESKLDTIEEDSKKAFFEEIEEKLENLKENILYEDLSDEENGLLNEIFEILLEKNSIKKEDILDILEKRNEYVLGFEDFDTNLKIEEDINKIVRLINDTYKIGKINNLWKQRIKESKKVISSQLDGVSRAITDVARSMHIGKNKFEEEKKEIIILCRQKGIDVVELEIEKSKSGRYKVSIYTKYSEQDEKTDEIEIILSRILRSDIVLSKSTTSLEDKALCKYTYMSKDKFNIQIGIATEKKDGTPVSGDSNVETRLDDGKYLIAISDGMGSGLDAKKASQTAVNMLSRMLSSGFDKDTSMELINSSMYINSKEDSYATLDIAILDLFSGNMEFMKNGACPTFIKNQRNVKVVKSVSLPAGILDEVDLVVYDKDLNDGDIIIMCSDGVLESNLEYENKEIWIKNLLEEIETDNVQKIANILLAQAVDNGVGKAKDDMTVVAFKIKKI